MAAAQPLRASCVAPGLLLGVESSRQAGIIVWRGQGGELQRPQDGHFQRAAPLCAPRDGSTRSWRATPGTCVLEAAKWATLSRPQSYSTVPARRPSGSTASLECGEQPKGNSTARGIGAASARLAAPTVDAFQEAVELLGAPLVLALLPPRREARASAQWVDALQQNAHLRAKQILGCAPASFSRGILNRQET